MDVKLSNITQGLEKEMFQVGQFAQLCLKLLYDPKRDVSSWTICTIMFKSTV